MLDILQIVLSLGSLVCFVLVVVKMFQNNQTNLGIVSLVLLLCCGIGGLVAFVFGWVKSKEWNILPVMLAWTLLTVVSLVLTVIQLPAKMAEIEKMQQQQKQFGK